MTVSDQPGPEPKASPLSGPFWETPDFYGQAEALNSMGTIAAPLLAGFSLAAMVQTLTIKTSDARWPEAALLLFMLAAVLFVTSVQAMFWARQYQVNPEDIKDWWPDAEDPRRLTLLRRDQKRHAAGFRMWSNRARVAYSAALLCLLAALTTLAVPPESHGTSSLRWLTVGVGAGAFIAETIWIMGSFAKPKWMRRLLDPPPDGTSDSSYAASIRRRG